MNTRYTDEQLAAIAYAYVFASKDETSFSDTEDDFYKNPDPERNAMIRAVKWLRAKPRDEDPQKLFRGFYLRWWLTYPSEYADTPNHMRRPNFSVRDHLRNELIPGLEKTDYDYIGAIESLQKLFEVPVQRN